MGDDTWTGASNVLDGVHKAAGSPHNRNCPIAHRDQLWAVLWLIMCSTADIHRYALYQNLFFPSFKNNKFTSIKDHIS